MEEEKNAVCGFFCPILIGAPPAVLLVPFQRVHLMCPVPAVKEVIPANENPALEAAPSSQLDTLGSVHTTVGFRSAAPRTEPPNGCPTVVWTEP